ncbi:MAG: PUA domain-containing protein [Nitrososphaeraceae archaeon]
MFRAPTREELTQLRRSFDRWGIFAFMEVQILILNHDRLVNKKEVHLTTKTSQAILDLKTLQSYQVGLAIGELRNKKFIPLLPGAEIIARYSVNFPYVVVNEIAEGLVLYGRDILGESVVEVSNRLNQNKTVIILNKNRESLGVGRTRFSGEALFQKGEATVYTLCDAGMYLRNQDD